ncbi:MAG TPA: 16S rRNA (uracil(1498)-N(3))-methyltransferase [Epsilonproteobacteria bacterium]|nr:16S rRNA (uracil(1498)-N(3))-methyltransferase [Campylobacterota bacterium]
MQYLYHPQSGSESLVLSGEDHRYLFKARRLRKDQAVVLRNLKDDILYTYRIESVDKKEAMLRLEDHKSLIIESKTKLHLGWCIIDPKNIEKTLPMLNEMGVSKITFIKCARSQQNFKLEMARLDRILLASSQQCGRSKPMILETSSSIKEFLQNYPDAYLLNFSTNTELKKGEIQTVIIGCEGGFTAEEIALAKNIIGFPTPLILRSESAACAICANILLG